MSDLAHERLQVLDFEQSIYKPERGFHEISALEHGYVGIIVGCAVQRIRSFWRLEGRERAGLRFWEGPAQDNGPDAVEMAVQAAHRHCYRICSQQFRPRKTKKA